jgi:hypothetical protein
MTTFTTEDRLFSAENPWLDPWVSKESLKDHRQTEFKFFWPLTEQIELGLDYTGCEKPKLSVPLVLSGDTTSFTLAPTWGATNIAPTLSVHPQNSVGQLNIGGISVGLENEPKWYSKLLYKLLGFNWKK